MHTAFHYCAAALVGALVLGGGTHAGFLCDVVLQLACIPLLLMALWRLTSGERTRRENWILAFGLALILVPLVQLAHLPPAAWPALRGHDIAAETFRRLALPLPWMPLSLVPDATALAGLALIPPLAIFATVVGLENQQRQRLTLIVLVVGVLGALLGLFQVAQGPNSPLRFYAVTNDSEAVGFFANRNHFAASIYCLILLASSWAIEMSASSTTKLRSKLSTVWIVGVVASLLILFILIAAATMARSRAGIGLAILALCGGLAMALADRRTIDGLTPAKVIAATAVFALIFVVQFTLFRMMERFGGDPLADARVQFGVNTLQAARAFAPFGAGLGSFVSTYPLFEGAKDLLADTYANRAHNDFLESALETGLMGAALFTAFAFWFVSRTFALWRGSNFGAAPIDIALARAATLIILLLLLHSVVDYHLRTTAMACVAALALGLLFEGSRTVPVQDEAVHAAKVEPRRSRVWHLSQVLPREAAPSRPQTVAWPDDSSPAGKSRNTAPDAGEFQWPPEWTKK